MIPSQENLRSLLYYSRVTGEFHWKKRAGDDRMTKLWNTRFAGKLAGSINQKGYRQIRIARRLYCAHKLAWLYVHGEWREGILDHKNRDPGNNAISNLRPATRAQNCVNAAKPKTNTSGFKGVQWNKQRGKWAAVMRVDGRERMLGLYTDVLDAARSYEDAAARHHGEFAHTGHDPAHERAASAGDMAYQLAKEGW